jgi:hypothetical protein
MLVQIMAADTDAERHRGEGRRHARHRSRLADRAERPSLPARFAATIAGTLRRDRHSLTSYPCRLPDGKLGRVAVVIVDGDWTMVCRVA